MLNKLAQILLRDVDDATFSRLQYFRRHLRWPDLKNPRTFNEKILWLKINHRDPLLRVCADKFTVRDFVREKIGEEFLIPLVGAWESAPAIDFESLPNRFALKASHGSGWNILCRDKARFDFESTRKTAARWLDSDFSKVGREWTYVGLTPRILCEHFLTGPDGEPPWDYKFFCYHGEPRFVQVDYSRFQGHTRALYDTFWNRIPCQLEYRLQKKNSPRPATIKTMLSLAEKLSKPFPFVRVDLYEVGDKNYFGELTFYPGKGVERFKPGRYDRIFGEPLDLAKIPEA
jgi:hypothetical protein